MPHKSRIYDSSATEWDDSEDSDDLEDDSEESGDKKVEEVPVTPCTPAQLRIREYVLLALKYEVSQPSPIQAYSGQLVSPWGPGKRKAEDEVSTLFKKAKTEETSGDGYTTLFAGNLGWGVTDERL
ncbi:hypothetical protein NPX13_g4535 [Xylaria arbuscula]|uniref:Uncharacterized protein n=1 Tax=Xylaria arbuscula TaxID=114810 RepID=A0A9W8NG71_9PEZI|nr:hypothetical protein NPX13_g4535 [Xylaria arbuscula]